MKKSNVINLIRYHVENNKSAFHSEAIEIAKAFEKSGDTPLAQYVMAIISGNNLFSPQVSEEKEEISSDFFDEISTDSLDPLPLPDSVSDDVENIITSISRHRGLHKFLFQGKPGTGKTQACLQIARILKRKLYSVNFSYLIDSKLGQTQKNVSRVFEEISSVANPFNFIFLLDEIDAIALDRLNKQDLREMGRVTSSFLKALDGLSEDVILIATTNLFSKMDPALIRRFDFVVDFDRYSQEDLCEIANVLLDLYLRKYGCSGKNSTLAKKIFQLKALPMPADIKNKIRLATAFSLPDKPFDYLPRLYKAFLEKPADDARQLKQEGFTLREIEILTHVPRSTVSRNLNKAKL